MGDNRPEIPAAMLEDIGAIDILVEDRDIISFITCTAQDSEALIAL
jgi:hypothetical protein